MDKIEFMASFPDIMSAIRVTGNQSGMRIQLDIPQSEMAQASWLLAMTNKRLKVTVEVDDNESIGNGRAVKRTTAKRRE